MRKMEEISQEEAEKLIKQSKTKKEPVEGEPTSSRIIQTKDEIIINP